MLTVNLDKKLGFYKSSRKQGSILVELFDSDEVMVSGLHTHLNSENEKVQTLVTFWEDLKMLKVLLGLKPDYKGITENILQDIVEIFLDKTIEINKEIGKLFEKVNIPVYYYNGKQKYPKIIMESVNGNRFQVVLNHTMKEWRDKIKEITDYDECVGNAIWPVLESELKNGAMEPQDFDECEYWLITDETDPDLEQEDPGNRTIDNLFEMLKDYL